MKARVRADAAIFAAFLICGLVGLWLSKFPVDKTVWWTGLIVFAGWLIIEVCFISPYRHAQTLSDKIKVETDKVIVLEERMKSRIRITCGKQTDKSFVSKNGETWYRVRLDLQGVVPVPDIEATVTDLWEDGVKVKLQENLIVTMHPGIYAALPYPLDRNLKTLNGGSPEFVDLVHVTKEGLAVFPLKFCPGSVDNYALFKSRHTYRITAAIQSPSNIADICTFEFKWTGNTDTSDIRLISVTPPPLLTPDMATYLH